MSTGAPRYLHTVAQASWPVGQMPLQSWPGGQLLLQNWAPPGAPDTPWQVHSQHPQSAVWAQG